MRQRGFLAEYESATRHAMAQRHRLYLYATVFIYHLLLRRVDGMEHDVILQSVAEIVNLRLQHGLQVLMGIDMQGGGATEHAESRNHAYQSEAMVTMKM